MHGAQWFICVIWFLCLFSQSDFKTSGWITRWRKYYMIYNQINSWPGRNTSIKVETCFMIKKFCLNFCCIQSTFKILQTFEKNVCKKIYLLRFNFSCTMYNFTRRRQIPHVLTSDSIGPTMGDKDKEEGQKSQHLVWKIFSLHFLSNC